jgi:hypothetical protein
LAMPKTKTVTLDMGNFTVKVEVPKGFKVEELNITIAKDGENHSQHLNAVWYAMEPPMREEDGGYYCPPPRRRLSRRHR